MLFADRHSYDLIHPTHHPQPVAHYLSRHKSFSLCISLATPTARALWRPPPLPLARSSSAASDGVMDPNFPVARAIRRRLKSSALPSNATSNYFLVTIARAFLRLRHHRRPHQTHRPPSPSSSPFPPSPYAPVTTPPVSLLMEMIVVLIYCTCTI